MDEQTAMFSRLKDIESRYRDLEQLLSDPAVVGKPGIYQKYAKEHADLTELVETALAGFKPGLLTHASARADLLDFLFERLRNLLREQGHDAAVVDAVLALLDALRMGRARERALAADLLKTALGDTRHESQ